MANSSVSAALGRLSEFAQRIVLCAEQQHQHLSHGNLLLKVSRRRRANSLKDKIQEVNEAKNLQKHPAKGKEVGRSAGLPERLEEASKDRTGIEGRIKRHPLWQAGASAYFLTLSGMLLQ